MLPTLTPQQRAAAYGLVGGVPLYLSWWDQELSFTDNLRELVCTPGGRLLTETDLILKSDLDVGQSAQPVLNAIAAGKTTHSEIKDAVRFEPSRTLDRLIELQLINRVQPVGQDRTTRRSYRISEPFLAFQLGHVARFRGEIERGLGDGITAVLAETFNDHMGPVWEECFRDHLRLRVATNRLSFPAPVVGIGPWWDGNGANELDAVVLTGRSRTAALVGEAKWGQIEDGRRLVERLRRKVQDGLHLDPDSVKYAVCARAEIVHTPADALTVTAMDIFSSEES